MSGRERDEAFQQTHGDRPGRRILGRLMIGNPPVWVVRDREDETMSSRSGFASD